VCACVCVCVCLACVSVLETVKQMAFTSMTLYTARFTVYI
jgi:hypothetical protein